MELIAISDVHGDCTTDYKLVISFDTTVRDIVNHAKEKKEWGEFIINGKEVYSGKFINMDLSDELMNKYVKDVDCNGGWGAMNYYVYII